jgi:hypothetical protein
MQVFKNFIKSWIKKCLFWLGMEIFVEIRRREYDRRDLADCQPTQTIEQVWGFNLSILRHRWSVGAADEIVMNKVYLNCQKSSFKNVRSSCSSFSLGRQLVSIIGTKYTLNRRLHRVNLFHYYKYTITLPPQYPPCPPASSKRQGW